MIQDILILAVFIALIIPTGKYLYHVGFREHTFADPVFDRVDGTIFRTCGIDETKDMNLKQYILAMLLTNGIMILVGYLILRLQGLLFFNPNGIGAMEPSLSFNTIISFMTNTNLQDYAGESGVSYLSQMLVMTFMMFVSAGTGFSCFLAFGRGLAGRTKQLGNFYIDMVRVTTRVLLPLSIVVALILVSQGVPQTLGGTVTVHTIEGKLQDIAVGPIASLEAIKHIGTNGGGFLCGNSATPQENPSVFTNMIEMLSMMLLPGACVVAFGHMVHRRKETGAKKEREEKVWMGSEAKPIFAVMFAFFIIGIAVCTWAEQAGNPALASVGLSQSMGNMEGKEVRFGVTQSALFTTATTDFTTGSVNNMHDSLTPLGGMVPLINMMLNFIFGGKGVGMMNMFLYVIFTVFLCGLMVGRTPEYLSKRVEGREVKLTALGIIVHPLLILAFTGLAIAVPAGLAGISNPGYHGLTQVLYQYTSSSANNGSGFEGLGDNTYFWNITAGVVMFFGRYLPLILQLAIARSLMLKQPVSESLGTLKTDTRTFGVALFMVCVIVSALIFFPVLALGPIAEHMALWG